MTRTNGTSAGFAHKRGLWGKFGLGALCAAGAALGLAGCNGQVGPHVGTGGGAYDVIPAPQGAPTADNYKVGPLDGLDITVFQEPEITVKGIPVDAAGNISMPLIGKVQAAGRTPTELADELSRKLEQYYVHPQVTVVVTSSVSQNVTVEGEVTEPGIYQIHGPTTLLDAVALAKGETNEAALGDVMVIRYIEGRRMGAVFDVHSIRRGREADPAIQARDVIVVGHSAGKQAWHDLLKASPLIDAFTRF